MDQHIFISHSSQNDDIVKKLRETLELHDQLSWVDSRQLTGGDDLTATLEQSVRRARHFLVLISIEALSSEWVQREVCWALDEAARRSDGYKVISVVLPGVKPGLLKLLFPTEPLHIFVDAAPTGWSEAMPQIFAAPGMALPTDWESAAPVAAAPLAELVLKLTDPQIAQREGVRRAAATAELTYNPADNSREVSSRRYQFTAPLGPVELEEVRWYIENYISGPPASLKSGRPRPNGRCLSGARRSSKPRWAVSPPASPLRRGAAKPAAAAFRCRSILNRQKAPRLRRPP